MADLIEINVLKSSNDKREYKALILPNKLKILLIQDRETNKPAAALAVGVGAGGDPMHLPGLAHFTEHMSMQGSDLFPEDNAYKKYLNTHGGSSNATTSMEHTWYRFCVADETSDGSILQGALDMYSRFFIAPSFNPDFIAREVKAIDAEDSKNRTNDDRRLLQVLKSVANPACSYSKYSTGNATTLRDTPLSMNPPVETHAAMREFHSKYYHPRNMGLCVVSRLPLEQLQEIVVKRFEVLTNPPDEGDNASPNMSYNPLQANLDGSRMKQLNTSDNISSSTEPPGGSSSSAFSCPWVLDLPRLVYFAPLREIRRLALIFQVPDGQRELWRAPPSRLFSHLLGHEGLGSTFAILQDLGWVSSLSAGDKVDQPDLAAFQVRLDLTEEGEKHWEEAAKLVFDHIRLLQSSSWEELDARWQEVRQMSKIGFETSEPMGTLSLANNLCRALHLESAPEHILTDGRLLDDLDETKTRQFLSFLTPENCVVIRSSKKFEPPLPAQSPMDDTAAIVGESGSDENLSTPMNESGVHVLDKVERWYGVNYGDVKCPEALIAYWKNEAQDASSSSLGDKLHLPTLNPYIPDDLSLQTTQEERQSAQNKRNALFELRSGASFNKLQGEYSEAEDMDDGEYGCSCQDILNHLLASSSSNGSDSGDRGVLDGSRKEELDIVNVAAALEKDMKCVVHPPPNPDVPGAFSIKAFRNNIAKEELKKKKNKEKNINGKRKLSEFIDPPTNVTSLIPTTSKGSLWWDLWHKLDATYDVPKANLSLVIMSPPVVSDPVHTSLFIRLFTHSVQQRLYDAGCAGLGWSLSMGSSGLAISVGGYNQRSGRLLCDMFKAIKELDPEKESERFELVREQLVRNYRNYAMERADTHAAFATRLFLLTNKWDICEKERFSLESSAHSLALFKEQMLQKVGIRALIHGNIKQTDAVDLANEIENILTSPSTSSTSACPSTTTTTNTTTKPSQPLLKHEQPSCSRVVDLPPGSHYRVSFPVPRKEDENSAAYLLFVDGQNELNPKAAATLGLLAQMIKEPLFTNLRTRQQLGYVVNAYETNLGSGKNASVSCLTVSILSKTHNPKQIETAVEAFMLEYRSELEATTVQEFSAAKQGRITKLLEPPKRLREESSQWWSEISEGTLNWDVYDEAAEAIEEVNLEDVLTLFDRVVLNKSTSKKFSVHVSCDKHRQDISRAQQESNNPSSSSDTASVASKLPAVEEKGVIELSRDQWKTWNSSMPLLPEVLDK